MSLSYRLAVLTHGDNDPLARTLQSFVLNVTPLPADVVIFYDGGVPGFVTSFPRGTRFVSGGEQRGFCAATKALWENAAEDGPPFVFWLEHDFEFTRPVDLREAASILAENLQLAQVALMRDAVNPAEKEAGGLFESRPGSYRRRHALIKTEDGVRSVPWLLHDAYFTTNPSLMLRGFMHANPWPEYDDQCEGRFGIDLRERGFSFGVMGEGEPWVRHVGERAGGFGY